MIMWEIQDRIVNGLQSSIRLKVIHVLTLLSAGSILVVWMYMSSLVNETSIFNCQSMDVRTHLHEFESSKWHGIPRISPVEKIPGFPPQMTIVKVCSMCNVSYWMAFPSNLSLQYYYFAGDNGIRIEMAKGVWDTAETRLANAVLSFGCRSGKTPALMVDVGMNTGYFSGMALAAGCRVVAFEPTKYHHTYATMTAMLSGYQKRFTLHKVAASDKTGDKVSYNDWSVDDSTKLQLAGTKLPYVLTARIDEVVREDVLYLKVDVEGHEPKVFRGLSELLEKKVVMVIVWENSEVKRNDSIPPPAEYLKQLEYFISELHHGGIGNLLALHRQIHPTLRDIIMAMKEINIKDALAGRGIDWWNY